MASLRAVSRLAIRSRTQPHLKLNETCFSHLQFASQPQLSGSARRISSLSRLPVELISLVTMLPLHSAIASARLTSSLAAESQSWGLVPQATGVKQRTASPMGLAQENPDESHGM